MSDQEKLDALMAAADARDRAIEAGTDPVDALAEYDETVAAINAEPDLVTWLRQQLDEDERVAQAASVGPWRAVAADSVYAHPTAVVHMPGPLSDWATMVVPPQEEGGEGIELTNAEHIARWNPKRVLDEVEAKRRILDDYEAYVRERRRAMNGWDPEARNPSPIVRYFALPYAGRPGWRKEWWA